MHNGFTNIHTITLRVSFGQELYLKIKYTGVEKKVVKKISNSKP